MADFVKVASGAKAVKSEGGHPQAKVTGSSELEPPVLKNGRGPQLEAKMNKQGHWNNLGQPTCGLGGQGRDRSSQRGKGASGGEDWAAFQMPYLQTGLGKLGAPTLSWETFVIDRILI